MAVLALDISTTATKAIVVERGGRIAGVASSEYGFDVPRPGWSEQDPAAWWTATRDAIAKVLAEARLTGTDIEAVGLTGQMHGLVLLDSAGSVLRPAILWNDQRTAVQCDAIRSAVGRARLIEVTGNDALTGFTAPKILWVRDHEPDVYRRIRSILLPKDYVRYRLTGERATDCADGSGTILFELAARTWSPEILAALDIDPAWLPAVHEGPSVTGVVSREAAEATGLRPGTPVVAGGGDQAANAVGMGVVAPGGMCLSLGTSGVVFVATDRPVVEPEGRLHAFCHAVPGAWHLMGVMLSAAGSLTWFRDALAPGREYRALDGAADRVDPGSEGLLFLPYLSGERTPHPDPDARGAFVGLTLRHELGHLARAVLEGVAFGLRDSLELIRATGTSVPSIRASGGGTRSPVWRQILADVLGVPIETTATAEGAAFGAAILAAVGSGWHASVAEACVEMVSAASTTEPLTDRQPAYEAAYEAYRELYPALRPTFKALRSQA